VKVIVRPVWLAETFVVGVVYLQGGTRAPWLEKGRDRLEISSDLLARFRT